MIDDGIKYGKVYKAEEFEEELECLRDSLQFNIAVSNIRMELEQLGFYLEGHIDATGRLEIVKPKKHRHIVKLRESRMRRLRRRSIILMMETDMKALPKKDHKAHMQTLEQLQIKELIERHNRKVQQVLKKNSPRLLENKK